MEYLIEHMKGVLIFLQCILWVITIVLISYCGIDSTDNLEGAEKYIQKNPIKAVFVGASFAASVLLTCIYLFIYYEN